MPRYCMAQRLLDSESFISEVNKSGTSIRLYFITEDHISAVGKIIANKTLKTLSGTMKLHQVILADHIEREI